MFASLSKGTFATLARRPGYARGLQVVMFVVDGPQASLASQSNTRPLRLALWKRPKPSFLPSRARLRRTRAILGAGGVARAGSGGKGKRLRARPRSPLPLWPPRAKRNGGDFAGLYIRVPTLHSLLLPLGACSSTSLVRDRR